MTHILVVDDDDRLRTLLGKYLRGEHFNVSLAADAPQARKLLSLFQFDLLVLDVMMPGESGLELAAQLRQLSVPPPILMLSARSEIDDRIAGFEAGVDDYLPKPFEPKELVLRIHAILRRAASKIPKFTVVTFGEYRFQPDTMELRRGDEVTRLTATEATLLKSLALHLGQTVSREDLAEALGQPGVSSRSIDVHITRLRRKLAQDASSPIHTVRGAGYVLYGEAL